MNKQTTSGEETDIAKSLVHARHRIHAAEGQYDRAANSVALLAVSKTKPVTAIQHALAAGQTDFGENYLDEALEKQAALTDSECRWHYIGAIQSNKTAALAHSFDWIHGVDREKIARRLAEQRPTELPALNCCIQINIDNEPSKAGILPDQLPALCEVMRNLPNIRLRGLMVIPAAREDFAAQRKVFAQVKKLFLEQQAGTPEFDTLSMGMSADIEAAIAEGSTMVRMGTAIFGARA